MIISTELISKYERWFTARIPYVHALYGQNKYTVVCVHSETHVYNAAVTDELTVLKPITSLKCVLVSILMKYYCRSYTYKGFETFSALAMGAKGPIIRYCIVLHMKYTEM